ncbi:MAG: T9SS type A sorting domain-containing protein [Flavobacteriales bacterium]|nr:T9SS type A sorting domain-containing protein [Flavobacteriales bacterium]MBK7940954.1 T9SS type A sorting domain-containing protein [Flavobacteriales bacterium]MBK8948400.1 T9SS type A sorting domain-containing protein [Flavobacteriales bacterium]MBK9701623.1 T9SS type A sorting domain-containing protein [Flavobacteriales bacterium]
MNVSLATLLACVLAPATMAQTLVFSDNFDSGVPDPLWVSTSQGPFIIGSGYLSPYGIGISSQDLNAPPLASPFLAYLFHPITFDPNATYELFSAVRVDDPTNNQSQARAYLGWIDPLAPDYQFCMGGGTCCDPWQSGGVSNFCWAQPSPNHVFGVVLTMLDGSTNCTAYFDNVSVFDNNLPTNVAAAPVAPVLSLAPNPAVDQALVTFLDAFTGTVDVCDAQGRILRTFPLVGQRSLPIQVGALPAGVLMLRAIGANGTTVQRFVKQ